MTKESTNADGDSSTITRRALLGAAASGGVLSTAGCTALFGETPFEIRSIWPLTDTPDQGQPFGVEVVVANERSSEVQGPVVVSVDGEPQARRTITLQPGEQRSIVIELQIDAVGRRVISAGPVQTVVRVQQFPLEFVRRDGNRLDAGCSPFYFAGANSVPITDPFYGSRRLVDETMVTAANAGLTAIRTWAFSAGGGSNSLQPSPGQYSEAAFRHLDYVIASAKRHGLRLVFPLVNNWGEYGGMRQYVDWVESATRHHHFYTNEECRELYRQFVETVLTRENTITGVEYRNDPTIMMWNLANEPRAVGFSPDITHEWFEEMAAYVKSIDDDHLLTTGMEGFDPRDDWWSAEQGTDFTRSHAIDDIDVCSAHLHAAQWEFDAADAREWIRSRTRIAHEELGKPIYFGEFAYSPPSGAHATTQEARNRRDQLFGDWFDTFEETTADGAMLWQFIGPGVDEEFVRRQRAPRSELVIHGEDGSALDLATAYAHGTVERSCIQ